MRPNDLEQAGTETFTPECYSPSESTYTAYCAAKCKNNKAGITAIVMKGGELFKLCNRRVEAQGLSIHDAEILAVIDAINAVPDNALLDVNVVNIYCVDTLVLRTNKTSYQDKVAMFDEAIGHLQGLHVRVLRSDRYMTDAAELAEFAQMGIVKDRLPE